MVVVALLSSLTLSGCGYPEVSPRTYEIATALYTICNREQEERLDEARRLVEESRYDGEITDKEAGWLFDIIDTARDGDWDDAEREARKLMRDQVQREESLGPPHTHDSTRIRLAASWSSG